MLQYNVDDPNLIKDDVLPGFNLQVADIFADE
jgi:hypothetical protein